MSANVDFMSELQARFNVVFVAYLRHDLTVDEALGAAAWLDYCRDYLNSNPEPGLLLTYVIGGDRYGYGVVKVHARTLYAKSLHSEWSDIRKFTYRPSERKWRPVGSSVGVAVFGEAREARDPSF